MTSDLPTGSPVKESSQTFLGAGNADHGRKKEFGPVGRFLEPRPADLMGRAKGRQLIGSVPDQTRSAFQLSSMGSTEGLAVHQPKASQAELPPHASGSSKKDGGEMPFREFAESIVMCKPITKCYTTEMGERAKAYEKAQRGRPTPGPGDYDIKSRLGETASAVKLFEETRGFKTDLDWTILRASKLPGPQEYPRPEYPPPAGGNFNTGNSKSDIDWICYIKKNIPGSGTYSPQNSMGQALVPIPGAPIATSVKEAFYVTEARRFQGIPGPGSYNDAAAFKKVMDQPEGGGRISPTKTPSFIDMTVKQSKQTPGAGEYNVRKPEVELPQGGRFGLEQPLDTLELSIRHLKGNPGPGAYGRDFQVGLRTNAAMKREAKEKKARMAQLRLEKKEQSERETALIRQMRETEEQAEATSRAEESASKAAAQKAAVDAEKAAARKARKEAKRGAAAGSASPSPTSSPARSPSGSHNPLPELGQSPIVDSSPARNYHDTRRTLSPVMTTLDGPFDLGACGLTSQLDKRHTQTDTLWGLSVAFAVLYIAQADRCALPSLCWTRQRRLSIRSPTGWVGLYYHTARARVCVCARVRACPQLQCDRLSACIRTLSMFVLSRAAMELDEFHVPSNQNERDGGLVGELTPRAGFSVQTVM